MLLVCPQCSTRVYKTLKNVDKLSSTCIENRNVVTCNTKYLLCTATATCDTPELPKEAVVTVNGTTEGSKMRITYQDGTGGAEFVCNKHGLWYLD